MSSIYGRVPEFSNWKWRALVRNCEAIAGLQAESFDHFGDLQRSRSEVQATRDRPTLGGFSKTRGLKWDKTWVKKCQECVFDWRNAPEKCTAPEPWMMSNDVRGVSWWSSTLTYCNLLAASRMCPSDVAALRHNPTPAHPMSKVARGMCASDSKCYYPTPPDPTQNNTKFYLQWSNYAAAKFGFLGGLNEMTVPDICPFAKVMARCVFQPQTSRCTARLCSTGAWQEDDGAEYAFATSKRQHQALVPWICGSCHMNWGVRKAPKKHF